MNENMNETHPAPSQPSYGGTKYLATIGLLLVIIIALLGVLWIRERGGRVAAEARAARAESKFEQMQAALEDVLIHTAPTTVEPVRRNELPSTQVSLEGQRRMMLRIGVSLGRRLGFRPGDLILVGEDSSDTQPVTRER